MNNGFSIKKARNILGKTAQGVSDEEIQRDIDTATFLKDIFFKKVLSGKKKPSQSFPNVP